MVAFCHYQIWGDFSQATLILPGSDLFKGGKG